MQQALAEQIAAFRDRFHEAGYHDEERSMGECYPASVAFVEQIAAAGMRGTIREYNRPVDEDAHSPGDADDETHETHVVAVVYVNGRSTIVDWTGRQFGERDETGNLHPYPNVQPEAEYRRDGDWKRSQTSGCARYRG